MSLYKDASLAMIPSAYKDGKLYSIRPTDGSGDFTFSRGSNLAATRVDVNGLIEKGRENLLLQSQSFDNASWSKGNSSVTANATTSPISTTTADKLIENTANNTHYAAQSAAASNEVYTYSVYVKPDTTTRVRIQMSDLTTGDVRLDYDFSTEGIKHNVDGSRGSWSSIGYTITDSVNGWVRFSLSAKKGAGSVASCSIFLLDDSGNSFYTGDNTSGLFVWGAQLELGLVATDYIETGASTAQAGILEDMPRLDYSGGASCPSLLLEPQRTNSVLHSEYYAGYPQTRITLTHNAATSPEGVNNATKMVETTDTGLHFLSLNGSVTSSSNAAFSIFAKQGENQFLQVLFGTGQTSPEAYANVDLADGTYNDYNMVSFDTEDYGNGWYRIFGVVNPSVTSLGFYIASVQSKTAARAETYTGDGVSGFYLYGGQIESSASYPTSYIPTYGSSVTRSDDFMNISSLADEIDGNSFTYFLEVNNEAVVRDASTGNISVGATGNRFFLYNSNTTSNRLQLFIQDSGGIEQYVLSADNVKLAIRFEPNKVEVFENGVSVLSTTQNLDFSGNSAYVLRGTTRKIGIKQTAIFPTALTDSECIALTTL